MRQLFLLIYHRVSHTWLFAHVFCKSSVLHLRMSSCVALVMLVEVVIGDHLSMSGTVALTCYNIWNCSGWYVSRSPTVSCLVPYVGTSYYTAAKHTITIRM